MPSWAGNERTDHLRDWVQRVVSDLEVDLQPPELSAALKRIREDEPVSSEQADSLETIITQHARPAIPVRDLSGSIKPPWSILASEPVQAHLRAACAAVGQLESAAAEVPSYVGTAFLVAPELVMTTRHVAESFATGSGRRDLGIKPGRPLRIDFGNGGDKDALNAYPIVEVTMIHPYLDIAVLRLGASPPTAPLRMGADDPGILEGRNIAVIAYPQFDQRFSPGLQRVILNDLGVKRIMPGKVIQPRLQSTFGRQMLALTHDAITLGGRSGGPVLDLETGCVVGVSFASAYLDANFAVPISELALDPQLWDSGLQFLGASRPSTSAWQEYWIEADGPDETSGGLERIVETRTSSKSVRNAVESIVREHFSDAARFREFLKERGCHEVLRAVPQRGDTIELVRALDRRGLLDQEFLQALTTSVPNATKVGGAAGLSRWLPQSMLSRVTWAVDALSADTMEIYTVGTPWRDYVLGEDGKPETASAAVQRLAYDPRSEIQQVLAWLLRRLYESIDTKEQERVNALHEAVLHLEGGESNAPNGPGAVQVWSNPPTMQSIAYLEEGLRVARSVMFVSLREDHLATSVGSTGWLLTPELVVVPAHVLSIDGPRSMDFSKESANRRAQSATVHFDFDTGGQLPTVHNVKSVALMDPYLDIAILRLAEAVNDRAPLRVRPDALPSSLAGLATIHHPNLGPKQISRDGRLLRADANDVLYLIDTAPGSGGAPIFDEEWRVIAVHRAFSSHRVAPDQPPLHAKLGTSAAALLSRLRDREGDEALWREVVAAQPALKSVNVNIGEQSNAGGLVPVVLRLLDDTPLGSVSGFHISSQAHDVVTGLCDPTGLKTLTEHPKVLGIELSSPAGEPECGVSVPHIGATAVHSAPYGEQGERALIALIDSGIDVRHRAFCDADGKTRIVAFWDQHDTRSPPTEIATSAVAESPKGEEWVRTFKLGYGALYVAEDIDRFLNGTLVPATFPAAAVMEHGTVVAGIAAGRRTGDTQDHFAGGVAPAARLLVVRYDLRNSSVGYSNGHIDALNFIAGVADVEKLPVVVNISNGMNAGAHDGTSPVERRCNAFTDHGQAPGRIIVKSAGNERGLGHHAAILVPQGVEKTIRWRSQNWPGRAPSTATEEIEIWFHHLNRYRFELQPPGGILSPPIDADHEEFKENLSNGNYVSAKLTGYIGENGGGFLNIKISKGALSDVQQGEWRLKVTGIQVAQLEPLHAWVELMPDRNLFFQDYIDDHVTITIPGTAEHVISVGAVEVSDYLTPFEHSSWGPTRHGREKPDLMAPGVALFGPGADRGDLRTRKSESGTSLAAPHVTGAIALALSACVKSGRPPHSSFRIKGALQETARHGTRTWNDETGYGALDVEQFFRSLSGAG